MVKKQKSQFKPIFFFTSCPCPASQRAVFRNSEELWDPFLANDSMNRTAVTAKGAKVLHLEINRHI